MMTEAITAVSIEDRVRGLLTGVTRLRADVNQLSATDDLYAAGLSSLATVDLMLAVEDEFGIEFTPAWLNRRTFATVAALSTAVRALQEPAP